jgi:hypothetical protein
MFQTVFRQKIIWILYKSSKPACYWALSPRNKNLRSYSKNSVNHEFYILINVYSSFVFVFISADEKRIISHVRCLYPLNDIQTLNVIIVSRKKLELLRPFYATYTTVNAPCIIVLLKSNGPDHYANNPYKETLTGLPANRHVFNDWCCVQKWKLNRSYVLFHILETNA